MDGRCDTFVEKRIRRSELAERQRKAPSVLRPLVIDWRLSVPASRISAKLMHFRSKDDRRSSNISLGLPGLRINHRESCRKSGNVGLRDDCYESSIRSISDASRSVNSAVNSAPSILFLFSVLVCSYALRTFGRIAKQR